MEEVIEPYYQNQAKQFIDVVFSKGYFSGNIERDEMKEVEDLLAYLFQAQSASATKCAELIRRAKERKADG